MPGDFIDGMKTQYFDWMLYSVSQMMVRFGKVDELWVTIERFLLIKDICMKLSLKYTYFIVNDN